MADTIKIGNLDISAFKVGSDDCKVYLGDTLLYPQGQPPTPTLQWVTFSNGDTIPSDLNIYGTKGNANDLSNALMSWFTLSRRNVDININGCYSDTVLMSDDVELIFSELGTCSDYYNIGIEQGVYGGSIQLYIYA